jgi:hypothetical protein
VKRGDRIVGDGKELIERLGRNDPCPCDSGRRFQALLYARRQLSTGRSVTSIAATEESRAPSGRARGGVIALRAISPGGMKIVEFAHHLLTVLPTRSERQRVQA